MTNAEANVGRRIWVFDTTLRDGEQSPGATMTVEEKLEVADALVGLGVDIIEAGFPAASPGDFEAVKMIAERVKGSTVAGLARANAADSDGHDSRSGCSRCPDAGRCEERQERRIEEG